MVPFGAALRVENSLLKHTTMLLVFGPSLYFRNLRTEPETGDRRLHRTCVIPQGAVLVALVAVRPLNLEVGFAVFIDNPCAGG